MRSRTWARGRQALVAALAGVVMVVGGVSAAGVPAAGAAAPEEGYESLEEALDADLGMTMAEFVQAGARAERSAATLTAQTAPGSAAQSREAADSFATLEDLRDRYLAEVGLDGLTGLAYTAEGYEIMVVDPGRAYDRGAGDAIPPVSPADWAARYPDVAVRATTGPGQTAGALRGGSPVSFGSVGCTHGFNGYDGSGRPVGISSGHCPFFGTTNVSAGAYVGTVDWYQFGGPGSGPGTWGTDLTTYRFGGNYTYPPSITTYSTTVTITGRAPATLGMPVCKTGRMTGWRCSTVNKVGWQWIGNGSGDPEQRRWVWSLFADTRVIPGDSGGPWVSGHKAVGITSSYDFYADGSHFSTAALLTSLDEYRPGAQVSMWLGRPKLPTAEFSTTTAARARWSSGQVVSGTLTRLSGDSVSPGTVVEVGVDGTRVASPAVASDGAFSFTYTGSDTAPHTVTLRARNGSSRGSTVTVSDEPAGTAPAVTRHAGADRYATAARIVLDSVGPGVDTVYVASGAAFPDALTGGALAGSQSAPVLLTKADRLPSSTAGALRTLQPRRIVVLGGSAAVSTDVSEALTGYADVVERVGGKDRYEVSANVAKSFTETGGTVFVASGQAFPDALSAAARAGATDVPLLITRGDELSPATAAQLERLRPSRIVVVGGSAAVSATVVTDLGSYAPEVVRVGGADRYVVSAGLSRLFGAPTSDAWVVTGTDFPDALAAGAVAASQGSPVLLARHDRLPPATREALVRLRAPEVHIAGGEAAIARVVQDELRWITYPR